MTTRAARLKRNTCMHCRDELTSDTGQVHCFGCNGPICRECDQALRLHKWFSKRTNANTDHHGTSL